MALTADGAISTGRLVDLTHPETTPMRDTPSELWGVTFAFGGNMAFTRSTFDRVGPFEEELTVVSEWNFSRRAGLLGIPVVGVPDAIVRYRQPHGVVGAFRRQFGRDLGAVKLHRFLGPGVLPSRPASQWRHDWRGITALRHDRGPDTLRQVGVRLGAMGGRAWGNLRYRQSFW